MRPLLAVIAMTLLASACSSRPERPLPRVTAVDVPRFMGDWYVIAQIPTFMERKAFDSVERYALRPDGRIRATFTYRTGSFDAPPKTMHPVDRVEQEGNGAVRGMQFIWPIQAEYVISWLDADYQQAIERIAAMGHDTSKIPKVPQSER